MTHRRLLIAGLAASAILPRVARAQAWNQQFGNVAVGLLAQWITASRQQALAAGTEPVPPRIVQGLAGYFQPGLEQAVRWRGTGTTELSLPGLAFQYGDAAAITLIDVVLFRSDADARHDLKLWAHELTHVEQYRRWGVDGFAAGYVADSGAVEREAYANADRFEAWRSSAATQRPHR
jgi:hypothetical protein